VSSVVVILVALLAGVVAYVVMGRRHARSARGGRGGRDGVSDFRRHIDALSPEARRTVVRTPRDDEPRR
jgi:hypothetical protein